MATYLNVWQLSENMFQYDLNEPNVACASAVESPPRWWLLETALLHIVCRNKSSLHQRHSNLVLPTHPALHSPR